MSSFHPIKPLLAQELREVSVILTEIKMKIHFRGKKKKKKKARAPNSCQSEKKIIQHNN